MKNFDQWTEELSREIYAQNDEEKMKIFWKVNEILDDEAEEEE